MYGFIVGGRQSARLHFPVDNPPHALERRPSIQSVIDSLSSECERRRREACPIRPLARSIHLPAALMEQLPSPAPARLLWQQIYWATGALMHACVHVRTRPAPSPRPRPSAGRPGTQPPFPAFNCQIMPRRSDLPTAHRHPRLTSSPAIANGRTDCTN